MLGEVIKPIMSWTFGSPKRIKVFFILLTLGGIGAGIWWMTNQYNQMEIDNATLQATNQALQTANGALQENLVHATEQLDAVRKQYELALIDRAKLEEDMSKLEDQYDKDVKVFNKERGRFNDLFQKKAQMVVNRANNGTERMRERFEAAASTDSDEVRETTNRLP